MTIASKTSTLVAAVTNYGNADTVKADGRVPIIQKGAANGVVPLGADTKIASIYLPSYVDDVLEFATTAAFPVTGATGIIYVALNAGTALNPTKLYRWTGSAYAELTSSPSSTDYVAEGAANLYFTEARTRNALLTGLSTATNAVITATDTVLSAMGKLQKQITDALAAKVDKTGATVTGPIYQTNLPCWIGALGGELSGYKSFQQDYMSGGFGVSTYALYPPVTGRYLVTFSQLLQSNTAGYFQILKAGVVQRYAYYYSDPNPIDKGLTLMMNFSAGEQLALQLSAGVASVWQGPHCHFSIAFMG